MRDAEAVLAALEDDDLRRSVETVDAARLPRSEVDGEPVLRMASNAYLGLNQHPRIVAAAQDAAETHGTGAGASPLVSGHTQPLRELAAALADWKDAEDAVVFPSGYHANTGTIPALVGAEDLVLSDELNHASIVDGCRLSRARVEVYRHGDADALAHLLAEHRGDHRRCLIVTDGVFSMDGEIAPLPAITEIAEEHEATLMVDDAHGTGLLGETGAGTSQRFGLADAVDVQMGTLSKALASQGGFVAGSRALCALLRNRARSYVFSTGLAPPAAAAAREAVALAREEPQRRERVQAAARRLREGLEDLGYETIGEGTPIVPVLVGDRRQALALAETLREEGVFCPAIRPPSVPEGTSRLRVTATAAHDEAAIEEALAAFDRAGRQVGVIG